MAGFVWPKDRDGRIPINKLLLLMYTINRFVSMKGLYIEIK